MQLSQRRPNTAPGQNYETPKDQQSRYRNSNRGLRSEDARKKRNEKRSDCLLYTSDAADDM
eukprot:5443090-Prorocentrum_lima.AAC.1